MEEAYGHGQLTSEGQQAAHPPSTGRAAPATKLDRRKHSHTTASAISSRSTTPQARVSPPHRHHYRSSALHDHRCADEPGDDDVAPDPVRPVAEHPGGSGAHEDGLNAETTADRIRHTTVAMEHPHDTAVPDIRRVAQ